MRNAILRNHLNKTLSSKIGLCSLVPAVFFALVPCFSYLLALYPPPFPLDSQLYVAVLKALMLTDPYFLFRYLLLAKAISDSKYFSYLLSVKSTRKTSSRLHRRFQFQMTNKLLLSPPHCEKSLTDLLKASRQKSHVLGCL